MLSANVLIFHNNAPAHIAQVLKAAIHESGLDELHHLVYFKDLASCDFHLKGKQFSSDKKLKSPTEDWLNKHDNNYYFKGTEHLYWQYENAADGDYIEK